MDAVTSVGVREMKSRFSSLAAQVNATGEPLVVMRNNKPWVVVSPADAMSDARRRRFERLRALTHAIEADAADEPAWDVSRSDKELLGEERMRRFG